MRLTQAYELLEVDADVDDEMLKANYRWLVKFYHPDVGISKDPIAFNQTVQAYNLVREYRKYHGNIICK